MFVMVVNLESNLWLMEKNETFLIVDWYFCWIYKMLSQEATVNILTATRDGRPPAATGGADILLRRAIRGAEVILAFGLNPPTAAP